MISKLLINLSSQVATHYLFFRVDQGGCQARSAKGLYLWLDADGSWTLTTTLERTNVVNKCQNTWLCWDGVVSQNYFWFVADALAFFPHYLRMN